MLHYKQKHLKTIHLKTKQEHERQKIDLLKKAPTGGGPCPVVRFSESEEELLVSKIGSSPRVVGLTEGIDTEGNKP